MKYMWEIIEKDKLYIVIDGLNKVISSSSDKHFIENIVKRHNNSVMEIINIFLAATKEDQKEE